MPITKRSSLDLEEVARQRESLRRRGRLRGLHWAIVASSLLITVFAWYTSSSLLEQRTQQRFEREVGRVIELVEERMRHYEDALISGASSLEASGNTLTRGQWKRYAEKLDLTERYPGLNGIGVIFHVGAGELETFVERAREERPGFRVHPETAFDFHLPIVYIEPEAPNAAAVGLDVAFESHRREAALRAWRLGTTQASGPIELVQDAGKTPGFLFYAPYHRHANHPPAPAATGDRQASSRGLVYAPIVVRSLVAGTLDTRNRDVTFSIRDGDVVLYEDVDHAGRAPSAALATRSLEMYGRTWTFDFHDAGTPSGTTGPSQPTVVLLSGLTIDVVLLALFAMVSRSNRDVLTLTETLTDDLAEHARELAVNNEELKNYAHIVSHDLKTPLRGIQDLSAFLGEDLEPYFASNDANPDVRRNLELLSRQAEKGQTLINGVLDYSSVGVLDETLSRVDVRELIGEIGEGLGVRPDQLVVEGELPVFDTYAVRLDQVFGNLIGNAFKYHGSRSSARVKIVATREGDFYRFAVSDDGPGIDPRYHERIFKPFTTLATHPTEFGSGVGLSIVQKSVELLGGRVVVESAPGQGTTFRFDWPAAAAHPAARPAA